MKLIGIDPDQGSEFLKNYRQTKKELDNVLADDQLTDEDKIQIFKWFTTLTKTYDGAKQLRRSKTYHFT